MTKIEIFDPALCCPTGVCGPSVDPELTRIASAAFILEKKGFDVKRFNLANDPAAFVEYEVINTLLHEKGTDSLPATMLDGEVVKSGEYPSNEELAEWFGIKTEELTEKKPRVTLDLK
jgi:hypothetical protein